MVDAGAGRQEGRDIYEDVFSKLREKVKRRAEMCVVRRLWKFALELRTTKRKARLWKDEKLRNMQAAEGPRTEVG